MDRIREHFEQEAREFDRIIVNLIPHYQRMVDALLASVPFEPSARIRAIDLGCGTGTVAKCLLDRFPNAEVVCLDLAENMLEMARAKFGDRTGVSYLPGDFSRMGAGETYDVVVSSLALHHLPTDSDKRRFYRQIYSCLRPNGVFYNADVVLGSTDYLQAIYMQQWRDFMSRAISQAEMETKWIPSYEAEDRPARLMDHTAWLSEAGFTGVDVVWKYFNFAVYGGRKP